MKVDLRDVLTLCIKVAASLLCGGLFYTVWLAAYLLAYPHDSAIVLTVLKVLAPLVTAAGFATGLLLHVRLARSSEVGFWRVLPWPLIGCVAGAAVCYPIGAMLIVFGLLAGGAASVALREVMAVRKRG